MTKDAFLKMKSILINTKIDIRVRLRILKCYIIPIFTYGSECWSVSSTMRKRIEALEMWFLRRMLRISWTRHVSNEEILQIAKTQRTIWTDIRERQRKFIGHVIRKEELEQIVMAGKIQGKKAKGRQGQMMLPSMAEDYAMKTNDM